MIRRTLDPDSDYVDAVVHGNGMTALQGREEKGAATREIIAPITCPTRLSLTKFGNYIYMMVAGPGEELHLAGDSMKIELNEPFYNGLAASAHDKDATVEVRFSGVGMATGKSTVERPEMKIFSTVGTIPISSPERQAIYVAHGRLESPFWTKDGKIAINTGSLAKIGNHTAISPDGALLGFTDETGGKTVIYSIPVTGGTPKLITDRAVSWFQGWSPDGQTVIYCGTRNGKTRILTTPTSGGAETAFGTANNNNDSPEYSPDGKFIYFNPIAPASCRSGE